MLKKLFFGPLVASAVIGTVPVMAQALDGTVEVVAPKSSIEAGSVIGFADLETVSVSLPASRNALDAEDIIGKEARRHLEAGKPVKSYDVISPQMVRRGDRVKMVVIRGPMVLAVAGKALGNAAEGESVRVQNIDSYAIVEGIATQAGVVEISSNRS